jgi:hypothetical protein
VPAGQSLQNQGSIVHHATPMTTATSQTNLRCLTQLGAENFGSLSLWTNSWNHPNGQNQPHAKRPTNTPTSPMRPST